MGRKRTLEDAAKWPQLMSHMTGQVMPRDAPLNSTNASDSRSAPRPLIDELAIRDDVEPKVVNKNGKKRTEPPKEGHIDRRVEYVHQETRGI